MPITQSLSMVILVPIIDFGKKLVHPQLILTPLYFWHGAWKMSYDVCWDGMVLPELVSVMKLC